MNNLAKAIDILNAMNSAQTQTTIGKLTIAPTPEPATTSWEKIREQRKNIQKQIKEERKKRNWTQRNLADKANMSQASITRAENNLQLSIYSILNITEALGMELKIVDKTQN